MRTLVFSIVIMVAATVSGGGASATADLQNSKHPNSAVTRPPLLKDNNNRVVSNNQTKPKSKIVSSRYMSSSSPSRSPSTSSSRRYPSPLVSRNFSTPVVPNSSSRSVSVDRRRRALTPDLDPKPGNVPDSSSAAKLLVTSTRSLSVSFQGEAFLLPISKTKTPPILTNGRKSTPERQKTSRTTTPSRGKADVVADHWPGKNRLANRRNINESKNGIHTLQLDLGNSVSNEGSDTDSVSSGSTTGVQDCKVPSGPNGILNSAKFWQETNRRLRRLQDPGSPLLTSPMLPKSKRYTSDGPLSSNKVKTPSSSRGHSPSRMRNVVSTISNSSVLSYAVNVQRGKVGENKIVEAHLLRLVYNRQLQWRFVNARTEAVLLVQKRMAEKNLWNAWITISNLRDCLTKKRHRLQLLRQKLKLAAILKRQMTFLEDWASLDKDHSISLIGALESLKATTLRLPVVAGATVNVQSLQDAIGSAVDVMQAMASSIRMLLPLVEEVSGSVTELAKVSTKERALLEQCTDFISLLAAVQVKGSSLRTHVIQNNPARTSQRDMFNY